MNTLERLRPEPQPLDPEWSAATLQNIFASNEPAVPRSRAISRRPAVAGAIASAAAVVAVVVGSAGVGTSAAFAVEQDDNGGLAVTIHRLSDSAGLEEALRDHGIDAEVTYLRTQVPSDLDDGTGPSNCAPGQSVGATVDPSGEGGFAITFGRAYLEAHDGSELMLTAAGGDSAGDWSGLLIEWSDGRC